MLARDKRANVRRLDHAIAGAHLLHGRLYATHELGVDALMHKDA